MASASGSGVAGPRYTDQLEVDVLDLGPKVSFSGRSLGPDEVIALEGVGTFSMVHLSRNLNDLIGRGKDVTKFSRKVHFESTRRGHASLTTSAIPFLEVRWCSRLLSMVVMGARFGSFLQESQRRSEVTADRMLVPAEVRGTALEGRVRDALLANHAYYRELLGRGIDLEDARYVLPLATATSFFSASSLESVLYAVLKVRHRIGLVTSELEVYSGRLISLLSDLMPSLTGSRLAFSGPWTYYPVPDPLRESDGVFSALFGDRVPEDAELVDIMTVGGVNRVLSQDGLRTAERVYPAVQAVVLEAPSLVAYHQSIRHRSVPTAVESLVEAADRALKEPERSVVVPPRLRSSEALTSEFVARVLSMLELYRSVREELGPAAALYLVPQAVRIRTLRVYDLFNLLSPMGFVATRTCSAAQWEERAIAYRIWREVERSVPELGRLMGEKCRHLGYCPEKEWCPIILKYRRYDDEIHRRLNEPQSGP
ncbi:MAG: FAD-dependent thymidylate synthase [Nitrososphaerota archaeon]